MQQEMYKYQELDGKIRTIERELNRNDDRARGKKLSAMKKEADDLMHKWDVRIADLQRLLVNFKANYDSMVAQVEEYKKGFEEVEDAEELAYLKKKVSTLYDSIVMMQKECKNILSESEDIVARYDELKKKLPKINEQLAVCKVNFDKLLRKKQPEVNAIRKEMDALAEVINPRDLENYKKIRSHDTYPVYVPLLASNRCGGCQMDLPQASVTHLNAKGAIRCEHCGRVIIK